MSGRIRSIKPEWLDDEALAMCSSDARVLSVALITLADDYGNGRANSIMLAGRVFPGKSRETLGKAIEDLARIRYVVLYEVDGQHYYSIRNWSKHQRVDHPGKPKVPQFSALKSKFTDSLAKVPETLGNVPASRDPYPIPSRGGTGGGRTKTSKHLLPTDWRPSAEHMALAKKRGVDCAAQAERFRDWAASKAERKADWNAAFRNWLRSDFQKPNLADEEAREAERFL